MNWTYDTTACADCYMAAEYGIDPDREYESTPLTVLRDGEWAQTGWKFPTPAMTSNPDGQNILGFSKAPCECCDSWLAGDRYAVSIWWEA